MFPSQQPPRKDPSGSTGVGRTGYGSPNDPVTTSAPPVPSTLNLYLPAQNCHHLISVLSDIVIIVTPEVVFLFFTVIQCVFTSGTDKMYGCNFKSNLFAN